MLSPAINLKTMASRKGNNGQHIKVFTRCRPMNTIEKTNRSTSVVECGSSREITIKERQHQSKTFAFDKVFGSDSKQIDVYRAVAKPLVEEVMNGFNCTIFAYGQTGTGKTFTMEGERSTESLNWDEDPLAGIIPRCVNHLFDALRLAKVEFTMKVSFLELYNEEIFDLLSAHDDLSKLRLYEDSSRKGSCIIQNLEEVLVRSKSDVYNVIEKGSNKRQTAATLMNAHSSRSHTVFTITLHIKENTDDGDELLKTGKLHLVDLAGSENIGRSGAVDKRAREAGNINQSLLTLGRVITSLVEKAPHIPYRESKLTRLLQDALGGRTKTSIIATVSPASINLEETLSTLDYAHRAKNIQNKPEVNQKLNKKELIEEYSVEIDRLRRDLLAMREKNGVYLANEDYEEMMAKTKSQAEEILEKINQIRQMEEELEKQLEIFNATSAQLDLTSFQLHETENKLSETQTVLSNTEKQLSSTITDRNKQKFLLHAHMKTEDILQVEGKSLINIADETTADIKQLQDKLDRKRKVEVTNKEMSKQFQEDFQIKSDEMQNDLLNFNEKIQQYVSAINQQLSNTSDDCSSKMIEFSSKMSNLAESASSMLNDMAKIHEQNMTEIKEKRTHIVTDAIKSYKKQSVDLESFHNENILTPVQNMTTVVDDIFSSVSNVKITVPENTEKTNQLLNGFTSEHANSSQIINQNVANLTQNVNKEFEYNNSRNIEIRNQLNEIMKKLDLSDAQNEKMKLQQQKHLEDISCQIKAIDERVNTSTNLINQNNEELKTFVLKQIDVLSGLVESISESRTRLETNSKSHVSKIQSEFEQNCRHLNSYNESSNSTTKQYLDNWQTTTNENKSGLNKSIEKNKTDIASSCDQWATCIQEQLFKMNELIQETKQSITVKVNEIETRNNEVQNLLVKDLIEDKATGMTPVRKEYPYSRFLTATSPHDRLLQRFKDNCSLKNSYTSDMEEDNSINSTASSDAFSPDIYGYKRQTSLSDLKNISKDENCSDNEGVFLLPTIPLSRSESEENKSKSISRSSSSSSLPDSKENSLSRKDSFKKTGLKQPTNYNKTRKILGNQN